MGSVSNIKTSTTWVGAVTTDGNFFVFRAPERCHIDSIYLITGTTKAASDSNYQTITVKNLHDDGTGTTTVADVSNDVAGGAITADTPKVFVMSTTVAYHEMTAGEVLQAQFNVDVAGTSQLDNETCIVVNWSPGTGSGI
jgi:hypothetical protein